MIGRTGSILVFDKVAQMRVILFTNRRFQRDWFLGNLENFADLLGWHVHFSTNFFRQRFPTQILQQLTLNPDQLVDGFDHVHWNSNRPRLIGNRPRNSLPNPPGRVG